MTGLRHHISLKITTGHLGLHAMAKDGSAGKFGVKISRPLRDEGAPVQELLRTNDPVLISYVRSLLKDAGIQSVEFDSHIANLEGSVSGIPCRIMVIDADLDRARTTLTDSKLAW